MCDFAHTVLDLIDMDVMVDQGLSLLSIDGLSSRVDDMELNRGEFHQLRSFLNDNVRHAMTTSVHFDSHEQLLWAGTQSVSFLIWNIALLGFKKL